MQRTHHVKSVTKFAIAQLRPCSIERAVRSFRVGSPQDAPSAQAIHREPSASLTPFPRVSPSDETLDPLSPHSSETSLGDFVGGIIFTTGAPAASLASAACDIARDLSVHQTIATSNLSPRNGPAEPSTPHTTLRYLAD